MDWSSASLVSSQFIPGEGTSWSEEDGAQQGWWLWILERANVEANLWCSPQTSRSCQELVCRDDWQTSGFQCWCGGEPYGHLVYHFGTQGGRTGLSWRGWRTGPTLPTCQCQLHSQIPHMMVVISGWESWETKALECSLPALSYAPPCSRYPSSWVIFLVHFPTRSSCPTVSWLLLRLVSPLPPQPKPTSAPWLCTPLACLLWLLWQRHYSSHYNLQAVL